MSVMAEVGCYAPGWGEPLGHPQGIAMKHESEDMREGSEMLRGFSSLLSGQGGEEPESAVPFVPFVLPDKGSVPEVEWRAQDSETPILEALPWINHDLLPAVYPALQGGGEAILSLLDPEASTPSGWVDLMPLPEEKDPMSEPASRVEQPAVYWPQISGGHEETDLTTQEHKGEKAAPGPLGLPAFPHEAQQDRSLDSRDSRLLPESSVGPLDSNRPDGAQIGTADLAPENNLNPESNPEIPKENFKETRKEIEDTLPPRASLTESEVPKQQAHTNILEDNPPRDAPEIRGEGRRDPASDLTGGKPLLLPTGLGIPDAFPQDRREAPDGAPYGGGEPLDHEEKSDIQGAMEKSDFPAPPAEDELRDMRGLMSDHVQEPTQTLGDQAPGESSLFLAGMREAPREITAIEARERAHLMTQVRDQVSASIQTAGQSMAGRMERLGAEVIRLDLYPRSLGSLRITLDFSGGPLKIHFEGSEQALDLLSAAHQDLADALEAKGFDLSSENFSFGDAPNHKGEGALAPLEGEKRPLKPLDSPQQAPSSGRLDLSVTSFLDHPSTSGDLLI